MAIEAGPSRQTAKAVAARQEILAAAASMMRQNGYAEMSLRELASNVGMKAGSLYYHFPSKDALAAEVMRLGVESVANAVLEELAAQPSASPRNRLTRAMHAHLATLVTVSDFSSAHIRCYPFAPQAVRTELAAVRREYDRVWDALIKDALGPQAEATQIRHLRLAILGALNWSLEWFDPTRDCAEEFITTLTGLIPKQAL